MSSQALALNAGWTSSEPTLIGNSNAATNTWGVTATNATVCWPPYPLNGWQYSGYWYPYYVPITVTEVTRDARPIKLTMAEVERLRVAAKRDKELRLTLEKFTPLIEVQVDFDK